MPALTNQNTLSAATLYVLLDGGQYITVTGALSRVQVDVDLYDGSTYSKLVTAAMLGNAHTQITQQPNSKAAQTVAVTPTGPTFASGTVNGAEASFPPGSVVSSVFRVGADDVIPGRTLKTRTLFQWWSAANGAGSLVAEIWADEVRAWSTTAPINLG
jgi:hypothetical protein